MANSISLDLSQFKSSGVYTIEIDNTERVTVTTQTLRLVVGYSGVGIHNAPVFLRSTKDRERFYGLNDKKVERKGSFFHRALDTCLITAPVFALSLIKVNDNPQTSTDYAGFTTFSLNCASSNDPNFAQGESALTDLYVNFFNRQRFWKADPEYLQGVVTNKYLNSSADSDPLFQLVNTNTKPISFIIRKAIGIQGYSITAKDFYGSAANIPFQWIRPYDLLKDYFIQVIAIEGDWTNYGSLSTDPYYSSYFNINGLKQDKINDFINLKQIRLMGSWVGTIIPDFKDQNGSVQYIETIINNSVSLTGILMNINNQALDQLVYDASQGQWELGDGTSTEAAPYLVDLVGHNLINTNMTNKRFSFLSYDISIAEADMHMLLTCSSVGADGKTFYMSNADASGLTMGTLIKSDASIQPGVTYVIGKNWVSATSQYLISTAEPIYNFAIDPSEIKVQKTIDNPLVSPYYKLVKLPGLTITNNHAPGYDENGAPGVESGVTKIYSMLYDQGIFRGLVNPDMIQYRYIVDTMAYGLQPLMGGKSYISRLAKARGKTTALLNAPSMQHFASSTDPYFCDTFIPGVDPTPIFNTQWIAEGGNPDMQRSFRFSFPNEEYGSKYSGVFGPFLKYNDDGKTILVPPAADISNTYIKKFLGGNPYVIVANKNGVISNPDVLGVEYPIDKQDRDYLEPFGYNSIIERPSTGEILIYSNATAYQNIKSDYNYLHVRELLNTIEIQVEEVLKNYVFDINNPVTRLNVINSVAPILEGIKNSGALDKYELVMDDSNNTNDIIQDGFAVIDIGVWVTKGMQKVVNRVSLNSTGGVSSGGFASV
jgi:hypothetical protein